ncbi:MAG: hypothetical protein JWN35_3591 [Frankiales bacterium]|nr:hypothetical protein [Frankiales bacterium]
MLLVTGPRTPPPHVADERTSLSSWLDFHRATLLQKCEGLDDEQLRRPMVPSGTSLLGLVKHLTAVEHGWFAVCFAQTGESHLFSTEDDPDADLRPEPGESAQQLFDGYRQACQRSRQIVAAADSLDQTAPHARRGVVDLRWILTHLLEETARHNGHADIVRELIDGATGD